MKTVNKKNKELYFAEGLKTVILAFILFQLY